MSQLHSRKIADEKNAFLGELLAGIPKIGEVESGSLATNARRLHEKYLPLHILAHYKPSESPLQTDYFDVVMSHWIESECLFVVGFKNAGMMSLRATLEAAIKLVYYENHPIEWVLHRDGKHDLHGNEFREFFYRVPHLHELRFNSRDSVEALWKTLCKFVHCDLRTITKIGILADIASVLSLPEAQFATLLEHIQDVLHIVISCCLSKDPKWLVGVEKAYFDAVLALYSVQDREAVKTKLRIS